MIVSFRVIVVQIMFGLHRITRFDIYIYIYILYIIYIYSIDFVSDLNAIRTTNNRMMKKGSCKFKIKTKLWKSDILFHSVLTGMILNCYILWMHFISLLFYKSFQLKTVSGNWIFSYFISCIYFTISPLQNDISHNTSQVKNGFWIETSKIMGIKLI